MNLIVPNTPISNNTNNKLKKSLSILLNQNPESPQTIKIDEKTTITILPTRNPSEFQKNNLSTTLKKLISEIKIITTENLIPDTALLGTYTKHEETGWTTHPAILDTTGNYQTTPEIENWLNQYSTTTKSTRLQ